MIEIVSASRCIECDICVKVCPANVFDAVPDSAPIIARQDDCQTCYLCEIYCPVDALYVAHRAEGHFPITEAEVEERNLFGSYARALGWKRGKAGGTEHDPTHRIRVAAVRRRMQMDRIVVSGIRKTFQLKPGQYVTVDGEETDRVTVLEGVDLNIRKGEFITLVGPSGSGKSVLLDIIGGLTQASKGIVQLDGTTITRPDPKTGYVFQQYALFPWRTALSNIEYALEVRSVPKRERSDRARYFLALFGLSGFEDRYPNQLSGGMQQRVAIARALASNPEVLLMDEPFAALDAQTREILQSELLKIWEKINTTVIFVTHSIDEAIYLADRIVVMTARPGTVKEIIDIDLPRPRDGDIRSSTEFNAHRARVWEALRDEVNKAQKDWALSPAYAN